jgi:phosphoribosylanthranilate isomerase
MLIKICGITRPADAEAAIRAGADWLGIVFVPGTPRFVDPEKAGWLADLVGFAERVGVFRDQSLDTIKSVRDVLRLDRVQLHGDEPDDWLEVLGAGTLRRVRPDADDCWRRAATLAGRCLPLLDPGAGAGIAFDWRGLGPRPTGLWVGLAGGLTPESVEAAVHAVRPALVDVSTGVEAAPGVKDPERIAAFVRAARAAVESAPAVDP